MTGDTSPRMTALVVDDSTDIRKWVKTILDNAGVNVVGEARGGSEGVEMAQRLAPDLVILDIRMPGSSGMEALQKIKNNKMAPVVVILTNYGYSSYRSRCAELGADYFVDKSKESERLNEIVAELTARGLAASARPPSTNDH